jgi:hypothetical protein
VAGGVGGGTVRRRRGQRDSGRRSFARETRSHDSGLRFGSGLAQEVARVTRNSIRGLRRGIGGCRRRPARAAARSGGEQFCSRESGKRRD